MSGVELIPFGSLDLLGVNIDRFDPDLDLRLWDHTGSYLSNQISLTFGVAIHRPLLFAEAEL